MFSSQACSVFRSHHVLSSCNWSSSARSLTRERGSTVFDENPSESLLTEKAHPQQRLIWALVSLLFFFPTAIIALFLAFKSFDCERNGHYEQALIYARRSFSWSMATLVLGLFLYFTLGLLFVIRRVEHY